MEKVDKFIIEGINENTNEDNSTDICTEAKELYL